MKAQLAKEEAQQKQQQEIETTIAAHVRSGTLAMAYRDIYGARCHASLVIKLSSQSTSGALTDQKRN